MRPADYGRATISPDKAYAGQKGQWGIRYVAGSMGIRQGGGLRVLPPFCHDLWALGKVVAYCSNPNVCPEVTTENTDPPSYHHSNYPAILVTILGDDVKAGETVRIVIGAVGGYVSGRFVQATAQTHAEDVAFRVLVDVQGNGRFSRERARPDAYQPCAGPLNVCVRPSRPARIRCTVRNSPAEGEDLIGVVAVEDAFENPISEEGFDVSLFVEHGDLRTPACVKKTPTEPGVRFGVKPAANGESSWLGASCWTHGIYGVSNPVCPDFSGQGHRIYFGDMHVMTGSCGNPHMCGTTEGALRYARDVFGLDFTAVTNSLSEACWRRDQRLFRKYDRDREFVVLPGYELGWRTGHKNVYYLDENLPACRPASVQELWDFLADKECMAISHHTNTHSETDREQCWGPHDLSTINPRFERLIEICQNRGSFETDEKGGEVSFGGFGASVRDALALGLRLGFVGGTDTHRGRPGSPLSNQSGLDARAHVTGGITGVLCKELTRRAIWDALLARRCYATTSARILMDLDLNGLAMGEERRVTKANRKRFARRTVRVKVVGTHPLRKLVIVRNGREVHARALDGMETQVTWHDDRNLSQVGDRSIRGVYYYAKVYQHDGNMAWTSPVWLTYRSG